MLSRRPLRFLAVLLLLSAGSCGIALYQGWPVLSPVDSSLSPLARGLEYLYGTQVTTQEELETGGDYAGNWPQYFGPVRLPAASVREVSPFMVAFIHHALSHVVPENAGSLGATAEDLAKASAMRRSAVAFMLRFEAPAEDPAAGAFGFWPRAVSPSTPVDQLLALFFLPILKGPVLGGDLGPLNIPFYPPLLAVPYDADDTAVVYAALLDHARLDDGPAVNVAIGRYFCDWRDLGQVPLWLEPSWLPEGSGLFLTWLNDGHPGDPPVLNDIDLVTNANILYTLARYDQLCAPGIEAAVAMVNTVILAGYHETLASQVSPYYPPNGAIHYCVSRAYHEGPVPGLAPAVERLAAELETSFLVADDGTFFWDRGDPQLNTALAVLTLLNAGHNGPVVDGAIEYLLARQDPVFGNWQAGVFFRGRTMSGVRFAWRSSALTTAFVVEALCRHALAMAADVSFRQSDP